MDGPNNMSLVRKLYNSIMDGIKAGQFDPAKPGHANQSGNKQERVPKPRMSRRKRHGAGTYMPKVNHE